MRIYGIIYKITNPIKNKGFIVGVRFRKERNKFMVQLTGFKTKYFNYLGEAEQYAVKCHTERGNIV